MKIDVDLAINMADEITAAVDGGAGPGVLKLYDENGSGVPADTSVAITTELLLAEITLNDPSFAAAIDATPGGRVVLDVTPIPEDSSANASATASPTLFARIEDSNAKEWVQFDTVGVGSGELQLNSLAVASGTAVQVTSGQFTVPEG